MDRLITLEHIHLGCTDYLEVRHLQQEWVSRCANGGEEVVITCEHPPTLTLGRRITDAEELAIRTSFANRDVAVVRVRRGGMATLHLPGQLVVYPVISLRAHQLTVKQFVTLGLEVLASTLNQHSLKAHADLSRPGVWSQDGRRKLGAVGLEIIHGITNHGFALNLSCNLELFRLFSPCGLSGEVVSSLCAEFPSNRLAPPVSDFAQEVYCKLLSELSLGEKT